MPRNNLRERGHKRKKRIPVVFIICEGKETEPNYFRHFKKRNSGVHIEIITSPYKNARQIVSKAEQIIGQNVYTEKDGDTIWCVFDCDANTDKDLEKASDEAKRHHYHMIFSNPCFELWYLLHFTDQRGYLKDCDAVVSILAKDSMIPAYRKNMDVFNVLLPLQQDAIQRARKREQKLIDSHSVFFSRGSNPSTNVFSLVEYLNQVNLHGMEAENR